MKRHLSAAIVLPLLYLYITKLPPVYLLFLAIAVSAMAMWEFLTMYETARPLKYAGIAFGATMLLGVYETGNAGEVLAVSFIAITVMRLFLRPDPSSSLKDISPVLVGLIYIPGLMGFQIALRQAGYVWILFLYGAIWGSDSMAYYFGKFIGGKKLYPSISPKKTIAGAVGSVIGGTLAAMLIKALLMKPLPLGTASALGAVVGMVAIIGDLVESMFKRDAGIKDSSPLIPGHGGFLDKLDSALFAGPVLYWLALRCILNG